MQWLPILIEFVINSLKRHRGSISAQHQSDDPLSIFQRDQFTKIHSSDCHSSTSLETHQEVAKYRQIDAGGIVNHYISYELQRQTPHIWLLSTKFICNTRHKATANCKTHKIHRPKESYFVFIDTSQIKLIFSHPIDVSISRLIINPPILLSHIISTYLLCCTCLPLPQSILTLISRQSRQKGNPIDDIAPCHER
jgi:hypothetical protein